MLVNLLVRPNAACRHVIRYPEFYSFSPLPSQVVVRELNSILYRRRTNNSSYNASNITQYAALINTFAKRMNFQIVVRAILHENFFTESTFFPLVLFILLSKYSYISCANRYQISPDQITLSTMYKSISR